MNPEFMASNGKVIDLFDPDPDVFDIHVIARALSRQCRFNGHTRVFYSVAEHSVLVSKLVPPRLQLWGLLHDAAETFLGDVSSPLKRSPLMSGYRQVEAVMEQALLTKFGVWPAKTSVHSRHFDSAGAAIVKAADVIALATEIEALMPPGSYWKKFNPDLPDPVIPSWKLGMTFGQAEGAFLERFASLS